MEEQRNDKNPWSEYRIHILETLKEHKSRLDTMNAKITQLEGRFNALWLRLVILGSLGASLGSEGIDLALKALKGLQ